MLGLIPKLPLYWAFRTFGWPAVKPFSVVISVSFRCNSKCRTCDVWRKPNDDLTLAEWDKVFASLGTAPFYMTFTGGEPFLRPDLDDLVISAYKHCKPEVITIPTNGMLTERVVEKVARMCRECPTSSIGINLSLDGIGDEHDDIRGVEGNWKLSMETWERLKELQKEHKNLVLTVHTVISRFNAHRFKEIQEGLKFLEPDSYITEVAEERVELDTVGWGITPRPADYDEIADFLSQQAKQAPAKGHRPLHAGLPRPVLPACQARPPRARPGDPLLRRLGQRPHRAQRRPVELLHPRRAGRQPAPDQLRPDADLEGAGDGAVARQHQAQGVRLPDGKRQLRQHAPPPADGGEGDAGCGEIEEGELRGATRLSPQSPCKQRGAHEQRREWCSEDS